MLSVFRFYCFSNLPTSFFGLHINMCVHCILSLCECSFFQFKSASILIMYDSTQYYSILVCVMKRGDFVRCVPSERRMAHPMEEVWASKRSQVFLFGNMKGKWNEILKGCLQFSMPRWGFCRLSILEWGQNVCAPHWHTCYSDLYCVRVPPFSFRTVAGHIRFYTTEITKKKKTEYAFLSAGEIDSNTAHGNYLTQTTTSERAHSRCLWMMEWKIVDNVCGDNNVFESPTDSMRQAEKSDDCILYNHAIDGWQRRGKNSVDNVAAVGKQPEDSALFPLLRLNERLVIRYHSIAWWRSFHYHAQREFWSHIYANCGVKSRSGRLSV